MLVAPVFHSHSGTTEHITINTHPTKTIITVKWVHVGLPKNDLTGNSKLNSPLNNVHYGKLLHLSHERESCSEVLVTMGALCWFARVPVSNTCNSWLKCMITCTNNSLATN